jgi:hypothetical protein
LATGLDAFECRFGPVGGGAGAGNPIDLYLVDIAAGTASLAESAATAYTGGAVMLTAALVIVLVLIVPAEFTARRTAGLRADTMPAETSNHQQIQTGRK